MDTRHTPEQNELQRSALRLASELGPARVADLDDAGRRKRLEQAVVEAGFRELRDDDGAGTPLASGVEAALIAEVLGQFAADVAFAGPLLAADLARRAGASVEPGAVVGMAANLVDPAIVVGAVSEEPIHALDCAPGRASAYVLTPDGDGYRLARLGATGAFGTDLTRAVASVAPGAVLEPVAGQSRALTVEDLAAWKALGLAVACADLIGVMRGVLRASVEYAGQRKQYGVAIGSFQSVQHLLAEAHCLMEGASSAALYPAWAVDELAARQSLEAARVAKAYCARAARTVCETAVQVHGGIGNTWDCMVHVFLRRALLSTQWFGDDASQLREISHARIGDTHGLP